MASNNYIDATPDGYKLGLIVNPCQGKDRIAATTVTATPWEEEITRCHRVKGMCGEECRLSICIKL